MRPATIVLANQVGLVTAKDGAPLPGGELVASVVQGHHDFQDASAFLAAGGQRGPQYDLLKPGTYYVNPMMFDVQMDQVAVVQRGEVAVLVSNVGKEPDRAMTNEERLAGQERYVVPAGLPRHPGRSRRPRRLLPEPLGLHRLHHPDDEPDHRLGRRDRHRRGTSQTRLRAGRSSSTRSRSSAARASRCSVSVKVVIRVRPEQAPLMVAKIGSIENLIDHVVHPMIDSSFRNQASSSEAMNFMQDRADEQAKAEARTREELEKYHVECVSVLISQIILPQELMEIHTRRVIAAQQQEMFVEQQKAEEKRIATENTRAQADQPDRPRPGPDRRAGRGADAPAH